MISTMLHLQQFRFQTGRFGFTLHVCHRSYNLVQREEEITVLPAAISLWIVKKKDTAQCTVNRKYPFTCIQ